MTRGEWSKGQKIIACWVLVVLAISIWLFINRQFDGERQRKASTDHATALATVLKRNQAITDYIPSLSEWIKGGLLEGKQLRKPYPTLDEIEKRIGKANKTETLTPPGKQAELVIARWYYGSGPDQTDLALEAEFVEEGGIWRLSGVSFWRGKEASGNELEYIGRDVLFWKGTRYKKRQLEPL